MTSKDGRLSLVLYWPGRFVVKVSVLATSRICDLRKLAAVGASEFLFNGEALSDSLPFSFYGIKDADVIVVVPVAPRAPDKWLQLTRDSESFHEQIQFILGEKTARETARIRDILFTKIEQRPRTYQRFCADIQTTLAKIFTAPVAALNTRYETPIAPSVDPLPATWAPAPARGQRRKLRTPRPIIRGAGPSVPSADSSQARSGACA
jgi:hypothetical protein